MFYRLILIVCAFLNSLCAFANSQSSEFNVECRARLVHPNSSSDQSEEIDQLKYQPRFGDQADTFWVKYAIANTASHDEDILFQFNGRWDEITLFDSTNTPLGTTGKTIGLYERLFPGPYNMVQLTIPKNSTHLLLARFISTDSPNRPTGFGGRCIRYVEWLEKRQTNLYFQGIFAGIILIMILYHLVLIAQLRDKNYFYYVLFLIALLFITISNFGFEFYLWPNSPRWNAFLASIPFFDMFCGITLILFTKSFLTLKQSLPLANKILNAIIAICLIVLVAPLFRWISSSFSWQISGTLGIIIYLAILISALILMTKKYKQAHLFVIGIFFSTIGTIYFLIQSIYHPFPWDLQTYPMQIGNSIDIAMFAYALSQKVKDLKQESEYHKHKLEIEIEQSKITELKARAETQSNERKRISQDMHDEIGSGLSKINLIAGKLANQLNANDPQKEPLNNISKTVNQVNSSMHDLVWLLTQESISLSALTYRLREFASDIFENSNARFTSEFSELSDESYITKEAYRAIRLSTKEIVNNIVKHAQATEVSMEIKLVQGNLSIIFKDNGIGFETEILKRVNGLNNIKQKIASIGGVANFESHPGTGTKVELLMPLTKIQ